MSKEFLNIGGPQIVLKAIDRFNDLVVSVYVTAGHTRLMLLHDLRNEDRIKSFFEEVHELYIKDQRRLGALILPTQDEVVALAKKLSILNGDAAELSKGKILSLLYDELRRWTLDCSFQIGPVLIVEEPFTGSS